MRILCQIRLICGDVGFGKTEVALRALFRCVSNGRQAALLSPTGTRTSFKIMVLCITKQKP
jgi:hypothetical protein